VEPRDLNESGLCPAHLMRAVVATVGRKGLGQGSGVAGVWVSYNMTDDIERSLKTAVRPQ
jgi:hypothetical protein